MKLLLRPLCIVLMLLLGAIFTDLSALSFFIPYAVMMMLFFIFLQADFRAMRVQRYHLYVLASNLTIALVFWGVLTALGYPQLGTAAFFAGIAPAANAAPVMINVMRGNVSFTLTGVLVSVVGVNVALLALLPLITGQFSYQFLGASALKIFILLGIPASLAALCRLFFAHSRTWGSRCKDVSFGAWCLILAIISAKGMIFYRENAAGSQGLFIAACLISLLICVLNYTLGAYLGGFRYRRETAQLLGRKNTPMAIYFALTFADPFSAMGPTFYVLGHNTYSTLQLYLFGRRQARRAAKASKAEK